MRHYNKSLFPVKCIECDSEFKPIMDKLNDEMGIKMNYSNPDDQVREAESNNRVIKERFRISYHRFPYKTISRAMIHHLAMNVTRKFNMFPSKGGVSACCSPQMTLSQRNLDSNKHLQVEYGSYVHASKANDPKNTNRPKTLGRIYLFPTPNLQGGHNIMYLWMVQLITIPKLFKMPSTYF